jgi:hypothetical protein
LAGKPSHPEVGGSALADLTIPGALGRMSDVPVLPENRFEKGDTRSKCPTPQKNNVSEADSIAAFQDCWLLSPW